MKKMIIIGIVTLFLAFTSQTVLGNTPQTKTFYGVQEVALGVSNYDEQRVLTFPEKPLQFTSKVVWEISFEKKGLFTNQKAAVKVEVIGTNGKSQTIDSFNPQQKETGDLVLQPGQICRITLYAGKYNNILKKYGAKLNFIGKFQKNQVRVNATEMNAPGRFKLDVVSIPASDWKWTLPDGNQVTGNSFESSFAAGVAVIQLSNPENKDVFQFDIQVPEPLEADPSTSPSEGYEDLTVRGFANITNHYQSTSKCIWDFGDGTPVQTVETVEHTYRRPGIYQIKLKITNSLGAVVEKAWNIDVLDFTIENTASITPSAGPIPLTVSYKAEPAIFGTESTSIQYLWDFGDGYTSKLASGQHVFRKVGDYTVRLTIFDQNHPNLKIEPWTYTVNVTPPVLTLTADASRWSGSIPLRVNFRSDLKIKGGPTEVEYYWDFNDGTFSNEVNPTHVFTDPGRYQVRLVVTDKIYGTVVTKNLTIDAKAPELSLKVTASRYSGVVPVEVTFTPILHIDGGPTKIEYRWDFDDGSFERSFTSLPMRHTFSRPGLYTVKVTARDRLYHTAVTSQVQIEVKSPVITSRSRITPLAGTAPLQVSGVGDAEVQGYPFRLQYTWFVDGQRYSFDKDFRYIFTTPGVYKITLTIADVIPGHTGRVSQSWDVRVQAAPPSGTKKPTIPPVIVSSTPTPVPEPTIPAATPTPIPVKDTKPPHLTVSLSPNKLLPANHKMIQITAHIQVEDDEDPDPEIRLVSITCNQTFDANADISGTSLGTDDRSFFLRAERDGNKHEDRVYTVTYSATDRSGNSRTVTGTVVVPFNAKDDNDNDDRKDRDRNNNDRDDRKDRDNKDKDDTNRKNKKSE